MTAAVPVSYYFEVSLNNKEDVLLAEYVRGCMFGCSMSSNIFVREFCGSDVAAVFADGGKSWFGADARALVCALCDGTDTAHILPNPAPEWRPFRLIYMPKDPVQAFWRAVIVAVPDLAKLFTFWESLKQVLTVEDMRDDDDKPAIVGSAAVQFILELMYGTILKEASEPLRDLFAQLAGAQKEGAVRFVLYASQVTREKLLSLPGMWCRCVELVSVDADCDGPVLDLVTSTVVDGVTPAEVVALMQLAAGL